MSLSDLLAQRVIVTRTVPSITRAAPVVREVRVRSEETARFGLWEDAVVVAVPVVSVDQGEEAAAEALTAWGE